MRNREGARERARKWQKANPEKVREATRKYREANPEKVRESGRKFREKNPERAREYQRKYRKDNLERVREDDRKAILKHRYGISPEEFDALMIFQGGGCLICGDPPGKKRLCVDHAHLPDGTDGPVRGLLCRGCNTAIGSFKDDPALCRNTATYLERK